VGVTGTSAQGSLSQGSLDDGRQVTFGDPAGDSYVYTDLGDLYQVPQNSGNQPCTTTAGGQTDQTDANLDILVLQSPVPIVPSGFTGQQYTQGQYTSINTASSDSAGGIFVMSKANAGVRTDTAQSPITQVTPESAGDSLPDFSPDGTKLAFQGPNHTIYTVPVGGGTPTPILTNASVPAWSPYFAVVDRRARVSAAVPHQDHQGENQRQAAHRQVQLQRPRSYELSV
jgi:hypothetical protein